MIDLRSFIEDCAPCSFTIGIAGDRWVTTILSFLAMTLATVGGFVNVSVDRVFVMLDDKGEPVNWPLRHPHMLWLVPHVLFSLRTFTHHPCKPICARF